jgi:hypothetical protein
MDEEDFRPGRRAAIEEDAGGAFGHGARAIIDGSEPDGKWQLPAACCSLRAAQPPVDSP